jgi:hypothetical protein
MTVCDGLAELGLCIVMVQKGTACWVGAPTPAKVGRIGCGLRSIRNGNERLFLGKAEGQKLETSCVPTRHLT